MSNQAVEEYVATLPSPGRMTAHQTSGEKTQAHDYYLQGSLYCGSADHGSP